MTGTDDSSPSSQVLPDTRLMDGPACLSCGYPLTGLPLGHACPECGYQRESLCLHCGYRLRGLPAGSSCPECGVFPNREAELRHVRDLIDRPLLRLGWRMFKFWRPLPAGFWWVLDTAEDRRRARARIWQARGIWLITLFLATLLVCTNRRETLTTVYQHPPGQPEKKELLININSVRFANVAALAATLPNAKAGWVITTTSKEQIVSDFDGELIALFALLIATYSWGMWLMTRWVWLPICLATGPRRKDKVERRAIGSAALYLHAPLLLLLCAEGALAIVWWALHLAYVVNAPPHQALSIAVTVNTLVAGLACVAAIRSDKTRHLFENRGLPIVGVIVAAGLGPYLVMFVLYFLVYAGWWLWETIL